MIPTSAMGEALFKRAVWAFTGILLLGSCSVGQKPKDVQHVEPSGAWGPLTVRRLSAEQYANTMSDIFGDIRVEGSFEPDFRDGLLAVGSSEVTYSGSGAERYYKLAHSVAAQVTNEKNRQKFIRCQPKDAKGPDPGCAGAFLREFGRLVLRRPITEPEIDALVAVAGTTAKQQQDFYGGVAYALAGLLVNPEFLFVVEKADERGSEPAKLNTLSIASRLSFFLWNSAPDDELLSGAERGELSNAKGLAKQVDRMMASPRFERGMRAFFVDFLQFDQFADLQKDPGTYPAFRDATRKDAEEQALRTVVNLLLIEKRDYRDLFTTRATFMSRALGPIYDLPVEQRKGWEPYAFPETDPRAGLLSLVSFTALHGQPGRSSPTRRGKAAREIFLCQKVPDPPGNVDFKLVQDTNNPDFKTARQRLRAHATEPMCAGCHKIMDPIGLTLEQFDGAGELRLTENGAPIDVSEKIDGTEVSGVAGLGQFLHDNPRTSSCLVERMAQYALGWKFAQAKPSWEQSLVDDFADNGHRLPDLVRRIATSDSFYGVVAPTAEKTAAQTALNDSK
jgi:hypothetical protein